LADSGAHRAIGPLDGDTWSAYRLVIESNGRAPFAMEPHNPPHFVEAFETAGFTVVERYVSSEHDLDDVPAPGAPPEGVTVRALDRARAEHDLAAIHALSLDCFKHNPYYSPISLERFVAAYRPILSAIDPDLVLLAESDAGLDGFLFGAPNFAEGAAPTSVILKTYASRKPGLGSHLAKLFHARAAAKGYRCAIHALMHERNLSAKHSGKLEAAPFRRYALFGRDL
jgi:hypothetical protein